MNCNNIVINPETGEIVGELTKDNYIGSKSQDELRKSFAIEKEYHRTEGKKFVFAIYEKTKRYLNDKNMKEVDITRLVVLSTYMNYENKLMTTQKRTMTQSDMKKIVRLSKKSDFLLFHDKLIKLGIMKIIDKEYYLTDNYFFKGRLIKYDKDFSVIRLYCDTIQYLFENIKTKDIKRIGYMFQLIPFTHYDFNVLCWNPDESIFENINPLTYSDILKIIDVKRKATISDIMNGLHDIKLKDGTCVLGKISTDKDRRLAKIVINPDIMYRGQLSGKSLNAIKIMFK